MKIFSEEKCGEVLQVAIVELFFDQCNVLLWSILPVWSYSMQEELVASQHARAPDSPFILHQIVLHQLCIVCSQIYFNLMLPT